MIIHYMGKEYPLSAKGSLYRAVSDIPEIMTYTPCGGHGSCGKCLCVVIFDTEHHASQETSGVPEDFYDKCRVPEDKELRERCVVIKLCTAVCEGISEVFLPDYEEISLTFDIPAQPKDSDTEAPDRAVSPVLRWDKIKLTPPTLEHPVDTLTNLRSSCRGIFDGEIPYSTVCQAAKLLMNGCTDMYILHSDSLAVNVSRETLEYLYIAADIGTTTIALSLQRGAAGREIAGTVFENPGRRYGGDVISRMSFASESEGNGALLTKIMREAVKTGVLTLCNENNVDKNLIYYTVIAGNSVMEHIYAGLDAAPISVSPFFMQTSLGCELPASDRLCGADSFMNPDGIVYYAPLAASYVGGDITAGMAYILTEYTDSLNKNTLFLDLGTNGEMCLVSDGKFSFAATAAGPALEGAEIEMGMSASKGAVCRVTERRDTGEFDAAVVGDTEAVGICGSGIIDAVACAVRLGLIAETGTICADFDELEDYSGIFGEPREYDRAVFELFAHCVDEDEGCIYFTEKVKLTHTDIRAIQTAKAAISAGIQILLKSAGITEDELDAIYLAGSFGGGIDPHSAAEIGILPKTAVERGIVKAVGNTSLKGAGGYASDSVLRKNLDIIMKNAKYTELSSDKGFTDAFIEGMRF